MRETPMQGQRYDPFAPWPLALSEVQGPSWQPYLSLAYLLFLFIPFTYRPHNPWLLWATLLTLPPFVALYLQHLRARSRLIYLLGIAAIGYAATPFNPCAFAYLTYVAAASPFALRGLRGPLVFVLALVAAYAVEVVMLQQPLIGPAIALLVCTLSCVGNFILLENSRKNAALRLSQEEVRRLAATAERERISRDLHDLLGHTLSLVAIKAELAGKLLERNRESAAREIADVMQIARDGLQQVRVAVTGMRSADLVAALASSRVLLESSGVMLTWRSDGTDLPPATETVAAFIVREAATNIHRHAQARSAHVDIQRDSETDGGSAWIILTVSDNGRGGVALRGNGLCGIEERVHSLGGRLEIHSTSGQGTVLRVRLPLAPRAASLESSSRAPQVSVRDEEPIE